MLETPHKFNFIKIFLMGMTAFFLLSCGNSDNQHKQVVPGKAVAGKTVFAKSCSAGSVSITKKTAGPAKTGDKVRITGTVAASACHSEKPVAFSCEAVAAIDTHRSFICQQGQVTGAGQFIQTSSWTQPHSGIGTGFPASQTIQHGVISVYDNGTKLGVNIQTAPSVGNPYFAAPPCPFGFSCL